MRSSVHKRLPFSEGEGSVIGNSSLSTAELGARSERQMFQTALKWRGRIVFHKTKKFGIFHLINRSIARSQASATASRKARPGQAGANHTTQVKLQYDRSA